MNADLRTISLCAGIGGLDLGFKRTFPNARTVVYVENEIPAASILAANIARGRLDDAPIWSDLKTFNTGNFRGRVDAILGGYPCQPFSVAGRRKGAEDPRHLWPYIRGSVETIQPRICVFENVRGHVRLGLSTVLGELRELGYRVRAGIFAASEVGAPHRRERVFIVAYRNGYGPGDGTRCLGAESEETQGKEHGEERDQAQRERVRPELRDNGQRILVNSTSIAEREQDNETCTEPREDSRSMPGGRRAALADSVQSGLQGHAGDGNGSNEPGRLATIENGSAREGGLLDDATCERESPRPKDRGSLQAGRQLLEGCESRGHADHASRWPSRPGEPQHEWEEPRTVDRKLNPRWVSQLMGFPSDWCDVEGLTREMKLRGLGNAVVPQQAEFAIRELTRNLT